MHSLFAKNCVTHTFHSGEVRRGLERFVEGAPEGGGESSIQAVLHAIAEVAEAECADWKLCDAADKKAHNEEQALKQAHELNLKVLALLMGVKAPLSQK